MSNENEMFAVNEISAVDRVPDENEAADEDEALDENEVADANEVRDGNELNQQSEAIDDDEVPDENTLHRTGSKSQSVESEEDPLAVPTILCEKSYTTVDSAEPLRPRANPSEAPISVPDLDMTDGGPESDTNQPGPIRRRPGALPKSAKSTSQQKTKSGDRGTRRGSAITVREENDNPARAAVQSYEKCGLAITHLQTAYEPQHFRPLTINLGRTSKEKGKISRKEVTQLRNRRDSMLKEHWPLGNDAAAREKEVNLAKRLCGSHADHDSRPGVVEAVRKFSQRSRSARDEARLYDFLKYSVLIVSKQRDEDEVSGAL